MKWSLAQLLDLGPALDPRRVRVDSHKSTIRHEIRSTPGARICIERDGYSGDPQLVLLACLRLGIEVELKEGPNRIFLDGKELQPLELRELLERGLPPRIWAAPERPAR